MRKISIVSNAYSSAEDYRTGYPKLYEHGFRGIDYQNFVNTDNFLFQKSDAEFERYLDEERSFAESCGLAVCQTHGPWRWPPLDSTAEDQAERFEKMAKALHGTKLLGSKYMVIHPIMPRGAEDKDDPDRLFSENYDFFSQLVTVAKSEGVVICFENMPMRRLSLATPEKILEFAKVIDSPYFRVCLDTGHCAVTHQSPADAMRLLGPEWIKVLHIHDNDGWGDFHMLPYTGIIDWADFAKSLDEVGYDGYVSLETVIHREKMPPRLAEQWQKDLFAAAASIAGNPF